MVKLTAFGNELIQVETMDHFTYKDEKQLVRRRGMQFYLRYEDQESKTGYLAPYQISNQTDGVWLKGAIAAGQVFIHALEYVATKPEVEC